LSFSFKDQQFGEMSSTLLLAKAIYPQDFSPFSNYRGQKIPQKHQFPNSVTVCPFQNTTLPQSKTHVNKGLLKKKKNQKFQIWLAEGSN
jgi:hypothetical protein